jgi:hypothetical protein
MPSGTIILIVRAHIQTPPSLPSTNNAEFRRYSDISALVSESATLSALTIRLARVVNEANGQVHVCVPTGEHPRGKNEQ